MESVDYHKEGDCQSSEISPRMRFCAVIGSNGTKTTLFLLVIIPMMITACGGALQEGLASLTPTNSTGDLSTLTPVPDELIYGNREVPLGFTMYEVKPSDTLFGISDKFHVSPETILYCNERLLDDNPHLLRAGLELFIPPLDGALHEWESGDTLARIAGRHRVDPDLIVGWVGNELDYGEYLRKGGLEITPGQQIFIPMGRRPFRELMLVTPSSSESGE